MDRSAPSPGNQDDWTARLRALLERRRRGPFISGEEMDARLDRLISRKRRENLATDSS